MVISVINTSSTSSIFLLVFSVLVSLGLISDGGAASPTYLYHYCTNATTFAPNSAYQSNISSLLSSLASGAATSEFRNASAGGVYGLFLCRGDVNATACHDCVTFAAKDVVRRCPVEKESMLWYDECQLRYSNRSFFGSVDERPRVALLNTANVTRRDQARFGSLLNGTMKEAAAEAARGGPGDKKFGTREAKFNGFQTLYNLAQCTPDLSGDDCGRCLEDAMERLHECCAGRIGGRVLFPSCNVRYEFYPFYTKTAMSPPPDSITSTTSGKSKISSATIVAIVVPVAVCIVMLVLAAICLKSKRAKEKDNPKEHRDAAAKEITSIESLQYDFATVKAATNNFSAKNKLGGGGFGEVYKGTLQDEKQIAVKRLSKSSGQGAEEFKNEVLLLAKLQHRNLVRLLGFCLEGEEKLLIYEFVPNKSLDYFLNGSDKQWQLNWSRRYKIIGGIARGILYLHEDSQPRIIHRDLKASNILLDGNMNSKISDFGMARIFEADQTQGSTKRIVGTYGYMSPEYAMHGQYSDKSDVYSFGVLILEIISGQKNSSFFQSDYSEDLLSYAWKLWKEGTPLKLLDPKIIGHSYSDNEVVQCIHIGLLCVQENPEDRPTMKMIVLMFNTCSATLPVPEKPAFYKRTDQGEMTAMELKLDLSTSIGYPLSVNEALLTELYPR